MSFCTDITATVFHLKLQGVKVVIFCWPLGKVAATVSLARAQLDGSFCLPIRQRFQPSSASAIFLAQPHHLQGCWSKSKGFHHNQMCCHNGFKETKSPREHKPGLLLLEWLLLLTLFQLCQISAAKSRVKRVNRMFETAQVLNQSGNSSAASAG